MEEKIDECEVEKRKLSLVVSGSGLPAHQNNEDCTKIVETLIRNKLSYSLGTASLVSAYRIGVKPVSQREDKRSIVAKFSSEEIVQEVVKASRTTRPQGLFFSENLIPKRQAIMKVLRKAKQDHSDKISGCSSIRGGVYVWIKPPRPDNPGARNSRLPVNTFSQLKNFCDSILSVEVSELVENWPSSF